MNMIKVGPAGGQKGTVWDEKGKGQIAKIFVSYGGQICSLQFLFVENDKFVLSDIHVAEHNKNFTTVVLDYPSEFLTCIRGSYEIETRNYSLTYTRSITFGTNKGSYGPYGMNTASSGTNYVDFKFEIGDDRSFGGFHGTKSDCRIRSIGVYVKPITSSMIASTDSQVKVKRKEED
nr:PREDICTED: inactive protein RESTRICTED TEV MOVEMENT 1-like [Nicotiana tabacum]XP_033515393.1 inactive protein RESTRICTED TEV MOVEMENT 1-like [Nicotiana tomentosiformis]